MEHRSALNSKQERLVAQLFAAFVDRDYPACDQAVFDLGMTLGYRYFTVILMSGINFDLDGEPSLQAVLISTIASIHLGDYLSAEHTLNMHRLMQITETSWASRLVSLILRRIGFSALLDLAVSDEQRVQAHYYEGEAQVIDRDFS